MPIRTKEINYDDVRNRMHNLDSSTVKDIVLLFRDSIIEQVMEFEPIVEVVDFYERLLRKLVGDNYDLDEFVEYVEFRKEHPYNE